MTRLRFSLLAAVVLVCGIGIGLAVAQPAPTTDRYVLVYQPGPNWERGKSVLDQPLSEHGFYLKELSDRGTLLMGGPFLDDSGVLVVVKAPSADTARALLDNDPAVKAGVLRGRVHPWYVLFDNRR
jgi:uncharacterized protein YciI